MPERNCWSLVDEVRLIVAIMLFVVAACALGFATAPAMEHNHSIATRRLQEMTCASACSKWSAPWEKKCSWDNCKG